MHKKKRICSCYVCCVYATQKTRAITKTFAKKNKNKKETLLTNTVLLFEVKYLHTNFIRAQSYLSEYMHKINEAKENK